MILRLIYIIYLLFARLMLVVMALSLTACVTVPILDLPPVSSSAPRDSLTSYIKRPQAHFVHTTEVQNVGTLGHQYMFVFVPLTSLVLGPAERSVERLAMEGIRELGYDVHQITTEEMKQVVGRGSCTPIVGIELEHASVNGYDALFFRILSVDVGLKLNFYAPVDGSLISSVTKQMSQRRYKLTAHRPELSYMFSEAVKSAVKEVFEQRYKGCP